MELYKEILIKVLSNSKIEIEFPHLEISAAEIVEIKAYKALKRIKQVLVCREVEKQDSLREIEEIIRVFEILGSDITGKTELIDTE